MTKIFKSHNKYLIYTWIIYLKSNTYLKYYLKYNSNECEGNDSNAATHPTELISNETNISANDNGEDTVDDFKQIPVL